MSDPRITELDRKIKITRNLTVANVSKTLKHVPRSVIKRSLERVKTHLINKFTTEKMELLMSRATTPRRVTSTRSTSLPRPRIGDGRNVYRQRNVSSASTLVNTLVNTRTNSKK